jgi:2-phospho-L-lactate/phosphoenolpyruvate guanylyltransferase
MAPDSQPPLAWSLVIPVKVLALAKTRLTGLEPERRSRLALAMATDTVAAALRAGPVAAVLVVTDDRDVRQASLRLGALVLADAPGAGLNEALSYGAEYARQRWPARGLGALAGDLPAMRSAELAAALHAAGRLGAAFVADADGTGTALYAAAPGSEFRPQFGRASRRRHLDGGAAEIGADTAGAILAGLRRDVDTVDDLRAAAAIGLGPRTLAELAQGGEIPVPTR